MTCTERPSWKRKRWIAVPVLWLVLPALYVGAYGPASYAVGRRWLSHGAFETIYWPLHKSSQAVGLWDATERFHYECQERGFSDFSG